MVKIDEIQDDNVGGSPTATAPSQERLLDAQELESLLTTVKRPTARMQLEGMVKRLKKESEALQRVEQQASAAASPPKTATPTASDSRAAVATSAAPKPSPPTTQAQPVVATASTTAAATRPLPTLGKYISIDRFALDVGGYNSAFVTLYIDLPRVGSIPRENVRCDFCQTSLDLVVQDLGGKSYRLFKDNLENDIVPDRCKTVVKADKVVVKLAKVKGEYGSYDHWSTLTSSKDKKDKTKKNKDDPQSSIMDMMKKMYDDGDDNMKKMIGETMMKQQRGELGKDAADMGI